MRRDVAFLCWTCGLLVLILVIVVGREIFETEYFFHSQLNAGKRYMDSLTDKDIKFWIQRTQYYLKNPPTNFGLGPFPPELQKLGITGIEEQSNEVDYVWLGGMDNTALAVERMENGDFQVTAIYTPYTNRVIWPKQ